MLYKITANDPKLKELSIERFVSYLEAIGWQKKDHANPKIILFELPLKTETENLSLVLPIDKTLVDADLRLSEAVHLLAVLENKDAYTIINEIMGIKIDSEYELLINKQIVNIKSGRPDGSILIKLSDDMELVVNSGLIVSQDTLIEIRPTTLTIREAKDNLVLLYKDEANFIGAGIQGDKIRVVLKVKNCAIDRELRKSGYFFEGFPIEVVVGEVAAYSNQ